MEMYLSVRKPYKDWEASQARREIPTCSLLHEGLSNAAWRTYQFLDKRGISSAGRAPALQAGGRRFDPDILHQPF